ncbi:MAG: cell division protein SepF [Streptosporangiales bacterium]|nr:cell division protein SepF [Streptosporangiales bacterium]MBO0891837.1 cell division protein SepF [Acidothermales bacterium]
MPGLMRRTMSYLGLVEDFDEDEYDYDEYDARQRARTTDRDRAPVRERKEPRVERAPLAPVDEDFPAAPRVVEPVTADLGQITTVRPRSYNDARTIGERFRDGTPVIMNLAEMDDSDAKRLVDFSAGLIFGQRGSIDRITNRVFLLSPPDVRVTAEDRARIVEGGFYNQS